MSACLYSGKKPRSKAPKIQRLVTPRVLQHKRRRIALKRQRTLKNKEEASEYAKLLAKRMKVRVSPSHIPLNLVSPTGPHRGPKA